MAGTTADKIAGAVASKEAMRLAIIDKGVATPVETLLSDYATHIASIVGLSEATVEAILDGINGEVVAGNYVAKSDAIAASKEAVRLAIVAKGVAVPVETELDVYATKIGEIVPANSFKVTTIDSWDGSILKTEYVVSGGTATPPQDSVHPFLTFDAWKGSYANITENTYVFSSYTSTDGKTRLFVTVRATTGLSLYLYFSKTTSALLTIDWGNGTTSTSTTVGNQSISKTYAAGDYIITIECATAYSLGNGSYQTTVFGQNDNVLRYVLTAAYIGVNSTTINAYAFSGAASLSKLVIPTGVTTIGVQAFSSCTRLKCVIIPSTAIAFSSGIFLSCYGLEYAYMNSTHLNGCPSLFESCQTLKYVYLNQNATGEFADRLLFACIALPAVKIPPGITSFAGRLGYSYVLETLELPAGLTVLSVDMLNANVGLKSVNIPPNLIIVQASAFVACRKLTILDFPSSLTTIDTLAFDACHGLRTYVFRSTTPTTLGTAAFRSINLLTKIYVPDGSVTAYKAATGWASYADYIYPLSTM